MLFKRNSTTVREVVAGSTYRHSQRSWTCKHTETAKVLGMREDPTGIVHVSYEVIFERPSGERMVDGPRILSLAAFANYFNQPIELAV